MPSIINASTAGAGGLITTADNSGVLQLQSGGTTIATIGPTGLQNNVGAPAFSAYAATSTNMASYTNTLIVYTATDFNLGSCYSTGTSTFTPTVAGYYYITANVYIGAPIAYATTPVILIYKNGTAFISQNHSNGVAAYDNFGISGLVYCNGTTDYIQIYASQNSGGTISTIATSTTKFSGFLARSA
jgi:hypothetical protein